MMHISVNGSNVDVSDLVLSVSPGTFTYSGTVPLPLNTAFQIWDDTFTIRALPTVTFTGLSGTNTYTYTLSYTI